MLGRNKVIKGLECCMDILRAGPGWSQGCIQCPYAAVVDVGRYPCMRLLANDALELIKAQEPRVLTLEEVRDKQIKATPVWKETKSRNKKLYVGWVLAYEVQTGQGITGDCLGMAEPSGRMVWYELGDYGKTWRCWSAKPTEEERKAVKWE